MSNSSEWSPEDERKYYKKLTGFEFNIVENIYTYETLRSFHGDGYSIWIDKIDSKTADYFKKPNTNFFSKFPLPELRNDWKKESWKSTPINKDEQIFFDFAYTKLEKLEFELDDLLNEKGNFYSYHYKMVGKDHVINIDLHIICPKRKIIITINHNT